MPSICYVHKDLIDIDRGGLCTLFKTLASGMAERDWKVYCITLHDLNLKNVTTIKLQTREDHALHLEDVRRVITEIKPDIAECSNWRYELLSYLKTKNRSTKVVIRCDPPATSLFTGNKAETMAAFEKEQCNLADTCLAISKFAQTETQRQYGRKDIFLVYNGIPSISLTTINKIDKFTSGEVVDKASNTSTSLIGKDINSLLHPNKINLFWVGKSTLMKGFDYLEKLVEQYHDQINFIINLGHSVDEVVWEPANYQRCTFIKDLTKNEQLALWKKCHCFLSTSRAEGFGLVVSEALALGVPTILHQKCLVFAEFYPNDLIELVDITNPPIFIEAIKKSTFKNHTPNNPDIFTQTSLVNHSYQHYLKLLNL